MYSAVNVLRRDDHFFFDEEELEQKGAALHDQYRRAHPFPHIVLDQFLPQAFAERILEEFPDQALASVARSGPNQQSKRGYRPDDLQSSPCRAYLYAFNSRPLLLFLQQLTGIAGLIPDPYFVGGGLHEIDRGGRLAIHADFNRHPILNLWRRVNVLLFLNKDWAHAYGGNLELWDANMSRCVASITPTFNRCVIFNTGRRSYHGHPDPLCCPPERTRRSLAAHYYTAANPIRCRGGTTSTEWRSRPGLTESSRRTMFGQLLTRLLGRPRE
jgi:Rps23 Pro-64 3,4-dihydroxylase Tpa1-like proline 4-hydroxylase